MFRTVEDVRQFWHQYRTVPLRIDGRKPHHEERYCTGLYLLALAEHDLLTYPLSIEQGKQHESPDFLVTLPSGETTGLEVTRATEQWLQLAMKGSEKEARRRKSEPDGTGREPKPVVIPLPWSGWVGDQAEMEWCSLFKAAIEKKLSKLPAFKLACRYDLLVYESAPLPAVDRWKVLSAMHPYVKGLQGENPRLGRISFIVSLDVLYDVGGEVQIFPYIEPPDLEDPGSLKTFSERSEYAGWLSAEKAVQEHIQKGIPIYSMEIGGRVVKQTADGRRFEVAFREDGEEVIIRELSHG